KSEQYLAGKAVLPFPDHALRLPILVSSGNLTIKGTAVMVDDRPEETGSLSDKERPKREPPTIDLKATEVSTEPQAPASAEAPEPEPAPEPVSEPEPESAASAASAASSAASAQSAAPPPKPISPWIIAPVSGAVAAALVIGVGWMLGWPAIQPA